MAEELKTTEQCRCRFLTCKEMTYRDFAADEPLHSGSGFWCALTQRVQGPDDKLVGTEECGNHRECYESA